MNLRKCTIAGATFAGCLSAMLWAAGEAITTVDGITEPFLDVTLSSSVSGIVSGEPFKEGDFVQIGDAVLKLDQRVEELEAARRKLMMDHLKSDMESTAQLLKNSKAVSRDEMQKKETEFKIAEVDYGIATEQLWRRSIVSPLAGYITEVFLHVGEACQPYQPLVRVVDTKRCYFVGHVEAKSASKLHLDQAVALQIETLSGPLTVEGRISFVSPVVDPASGLAKVKALFENADGKIRPGVAGKLILK